MGAGIKLNQELAVFPELYMLLSRVLRTLNV
jgi:hypothetical protein